MTLTTGVYNFSRQERLYYGEPAEAVLGSLSTELGWKRIFVVTSKSVERSPAFERITAVLKENVAGVFSGVAAHSPRDSVLKGAQLARQARADVLVAVGGGSVVDATKAMLVCLRQGIDTEEGFDEIVKGETESSSNYDSVRIVAVPSTLSAAEFTSVAGITDTRRGEKDGIFRPWLAPACVILDPRATLDTPDWLFLTTGIRSVDHAIEGLLSSRPSPYADALARDGLRRLAGALRAVKHDPGRLDARLDCQIGSWLTISGFAAGVPYGASHAIGRVLGAAFDVPHGVTSCMLLPAVLDWNSAVDDGRQSEVAALLGADRSKSASQAMSSLLADIGQQHHLEKFGIKRSDYTSIAEKSMTMMRNPTVSGNQRPITSPAQVIEILEKVQ